MNKNNIGLYKKEVVTVVGLGFVGSAMSVAISTSKNNMGKNNFTVYTCDFTKDYIDINTDYRN